MRHRIPLAANLLLSLVSALTGILFWLLSAMLPTPWSQAALLLPVLFTLSGWALVHESFHGHLHPDGAANERLGRILSILHGAPFAILRHGHLLHHRFSRVHEMSEIYDARRTPLWLAQVSYFGALLGGLYAGQVLSCVLVWLPTRVRHAASRRFAGEGELARAFNALLDRPATLRQARGDALLVLILLGLAVHLHAGGLPLFLGALWLRGLLVSFFDNAYHYGDPAGEPRHARNHALPAGVARLLLNFNYHGVHHLAPAVPWNALPECARSIQAGWDSPFVAGALRQLRGPIALADLPVVAAATRQAHA